MQTKAETELEIRTAIIVLGASSFLHYKDIDNERFKVSAANLINIFEKGDILNSSAPLVLDLFDSNYEPREILYAITRFLRENPDRTDIIHILLRSRQSF
ncbi:hypothetical protein [Beijerinckia sp. L45]|uniref:hypothetical protein n=1 Tax=Beijerinckia sp. L45 TaxID=1641855 RepID=UPI00131C7664|nr:hypothetical protein [Beijerinckia sp. L45]